MVIHAPLQERPTLISSCSSCWNFNPRSLAGATAYGPACAASLHISIHAPLRERPVAHHRRQQKHNFNPRSFTGATPLPISLFVILAFQSTLPNGSDQLHTIDGSRSIISIHAPSRERLQNSLIPLMLQYFNPRFVSAITDIMLFQSSLPCVSDAASPEKVGDA